MLPILTATLVNPPIHVQSDIFSLGIILFELLHPMSTGMERGVAIRGLRTGRLPSNLLQRFPKEVSAAQDDVV